MCIRDSLCGSHLQTLKMASAQVVETSVNNNSPSHDSNHPDDLFQSRYVTPGFKPFSYSSRFRNFKAFPARQPRKVRKIPQSLSRLKTVWAMGVRLNGFLRRRSSPGRYSKRTVSRFASVIWPHGKLVVDDNQFRWPSGRPKHRQEVSSMFKPLEIGPWCFKI